MNSDKLKQMIVMVVAWLRVTGLLFTFYIKLKILLH
jgi:hypothetical protein